jgi:sRNA-binding carbon storage regulator CsrA
MALVLTRKSGESVVFKDKNSGMSITATILQITKRAAGVRFTVGTNSDEREMVSSEPVEFFNGNFFLGVRDGQTQVRLVCDFPSNVNIARKELLK